jgi:hypothetical protein
MGTCEDIYREHKDLIEQAAQAAGTTEPDASWLGVISTEFGRGNIDAATFGDMNTFRANGCSIPPDGINQGPPATAESVQIESVVAESERPNDFSATATVSLPAAVSENVYPAAEGRLDGELVERIPFAIRPGDTVELNWVSRDAEPGEREFCVKIVED